MDRSKLHLTVAAVVHYQQRFLFVEEIDKNSGVRVLNQPAGHMEVGEDILSAIQRELLEETGLQLSPTGWLGLAQLKTNHGHYYVRVNFVFEPAELPLVYQPLDADILALHWLSAAQLQQSPLPLRSPLVAAAVQQYLTSPRLPLNAIAALANI